MIETPRLILRRWKPIDLEPFSEINADPRVMEFFPAPLSTTETASSIKILNEKFERYGFSFLAAELKSTGELVGMIGLNVPTFETPFTPCVEIGWRLKFDQWGKGLATEGALASLEHGFNKLNLEEIVSFTTVKNQRSRQVMERIGMKYDGAGDFIHPKMAADHPLAPHVLYRIKKK